jgi:hypothetical protein
MIDIIDKFNAVFLNLEVKTMNDIPAKSKPPLSRIIKEGDTWSKCTICGSSRIWKFWPFSKSKYCLQPGCSNYWLNNIKKPPKCGGGCCK